MRGLSTNKLIKKLYNYSFYDWEKEDDSTYALHFGISDHILKKVEFINLYDSFGYESVQNKFADIDISPKTWIELQDIFIEWLSQGEKFLFKGEVIVTPNLSNWWFPYDLDPPKWCEKNIWEKPDYDSYIDLLYKSNVIPKNIPSSRENYRGAVIESLDDIKTLGKIAVKNCPLLFFCNEDRVIRLTEYLTVKIEMKNKKVEEEIIEYIKRVLKPIFF
jgi:hypothetical protein